MRFLRNWLRIERPAGVALRPSRSVECEETYDALFDRVVEGIEGVLGGVVRECDRERGRIEATFGLMFSERLTCTLEPIAPERTRVRIESRGLAQASSQAHSEYVETLARFLAGG